MAGWLAETTSGPELRTIFSQKPLTVSRIEQQQGTSASPLADHQGRFTAAEKLGAADAAFAERVAARLDALARGDRTTRLRFAALADSYYDRAEYIRRSAGAGPAEPQSVPIRQPGKPGKGPEAAARGLLWGRTRLLGSTIKRTDGGPIEVEGRGARPDVVQQASAETESVTSAEKVSEVSRAQQRYRDHLGYPDTSHCTSRAERQQVVREAFKSVPWWQRPPVLWSATQRATYSKLTGILQARDDEQRRPPKSIKSDAYMHFLQECQPYLAAIGRYGEMTGPWWNCPSQFWQPDQLKLFSSVLTLLEKPADPRGQRFQI